MDQRSLSRAMISAESSVSAPLPTSVVDVRVGMCMGAVLIRSPAYHY